MMTVSELIRMLQKHSKTGNEVVEFFSYEWTDDLEECEYQERAFETIEGENGKVRIYTSR